MLRYVASRLGQTVLTLVLLSGLVFFLSRVLGDPIMFLLPQDAPTADLERVRRDLGLDRPLIVQYLAYLGDLAQGNLGRSLRKQESVLLLILDRWTATAALIGIAMAWAIAASLFLGVYAAVFRGRFADWTARTFAVIGQSAPSFWIAILLIQIFSLKLEWLPSAGYGGLAHMAMPAFTLGLFAVAGMTRLLRSSMIEVLDSEYVKKARIMGVSESSVIWKHALKNACLPTLTFAGEYFGLLITAGVVVETIFAWPGLGRLAYEAVFLRDFPLIQGVVMFIATFVMLMNLLVDVLYAYVDPRIRYDRR